MNSFFNKLTPAFILQMERRMLLNSPLAWQFQLPRILWFWLCITAIGMVIPFLMEINITSGNSDKETIGLFCVVIGLLQFFLYGYILTRYNATKNFVARTWWHGIVEQGVYLVVMMLCISQFTIYNLMLDVRRATFLSDNQIQEEIALYNRARHYFMANPVDYRYFPDEKSFTNYMALINAGKPTEADAFYYARVAPAMKQYFLGSPEMNYIDAGNTRYKNGPQLYFVNAEEFLKNKFKKGDGVFSSNGYFVNENYTPYTFQLHKKSKEERLKDIRDFKALLKKYKAHEYYYDNSAIEFVSDQEILNNYMSNQFMVSILNAENRTLDKYQFETIYENVMEARYVRWEFVQESQLVALFIAFPFAVLLFLYKNNPVRPIIITIIILILIGIVSGIITVIFRMQEHLMVHVPLMVYLAALMAMLYPARTNNFWHTVFVIVANIFFCAVPIYLFFYVTEYLDMFKPQWDLCQDNSQICSEQEALLQRIGWSCFWGGLIGYLVLGVIWFKYKYEQIWALPMAK